MTATLIGLAMAIGYAFGSIPFGLMLSAAAGEGDIRKIGSGNIGATNVLRTGRKDLAIVTLLLDAGKAAAAVFFVQVTLGLPYSLIAGAMALVGHCFPIWLKFKGGKGVATFFGALTAACWPVGLIAMAIWLTAAIIWRMSSLAALIAALLGPVLAFLMGDLQAAYMAAFMTVIIFIRHRDNIGRILKGQESKIGQKSRGSS